MRKSFGSASSAMEQWAGSAAARALSCVNCKHDSCKRALKRKREAGEVFEEVEVAEPEKTPRTSCFKIREVVGVDLRVKLLAIAKSALVAGLMTPGSPSKCAVALVRTRMMS